MNRTRPIAAITALALAALAFTPPAGAAEPARWIGSWAASPQPVWDGGFPLPTNLPFNLWNQTIRQMARLSLGGRQLRVVLSNAYGARPLVIGAAHLALAGQGSGIAAGSDRPLTFAGKSGVVIPPGAPALSDPVDLAVPALGKVAVSLFLPEPTPVSTFHWDGEQTAYLGAGNLVGAERIETNATLSARIILSEILVDAGPQARSVVAIGDSITDGAASTPDADHRWPDFLAERLAKDDVAVLNAGISGGRLLTDRMGVNALARFDRDVLAQTAVRAVIVLEGVNDLGTLTRDHDVSAEEHAGLVLRIEAAYAQMIERAHAHGVRVIGATILPYVGSGYYHPGPESEADRQAINAWIRGAGHFDSVVDFDQVTRDPQHPDRLLPAYDSGDHLHPGPAGYKAMGNAIPLTLFRY